MTTHAVRWGVIGPGRIAHTFAQSLAAVPGATLAAVASSEASRAQAFAQQYGAAQAFDRVDALVRSEQVDAVYIASTHNFHHEQALATLRAGKAVLCEKPLTVNAAQAEAVFVEAQRQQVFAMEALWTRFLPAWRHVLQWLADERIGRVHSAEAYFGYEQPFDLNGRLYRADLAGGALLDAGVYCVTVAQWLFGGPLKVERASATLAATGVDEEVRAQLSVGSGANAGAIELRMHVSLRHRLYNAFVIHGEHGDILVTEAFWGQGQAVLLRRGEAPIATHSPFEVNGFEYQVREVHRCLARGVLQSEVMPWQDTLAVMRCLDELRAAVGVRYPFVARAPDPSAGRLGETSRLR